MFFSLLLYCFLCCLLSFSSPKQWPQAPVGSFLKKNPLKQSLWNQEFHFSKIAFWWQIHNLRKKSCRLAPESLILVHCASSYGRFIGKKEFRPQCKVLRFGASWRALCRRGRLGGLLKSTLVLSSDLLFIYLTRASGLPLGPPMSTSGRPQVDLVGTGLCPYT